MARRSWLLLFLNISLFSSVVLCFVCISSLFLRVLIHSFDVLVLDFLYFVLYLHFSVILSRASLWQLRIPAHNAMKLPIVAAFVALPFAAASPTDLQSLHARRTPSCGIAGYDRGNPLHMYTRRAQTTCLSLVVQRCVHRTQSARVMR